jgi:hypothetical protein
MSDKNKKKDGPPNIMVNNINEDLEFEDGHESDTLLKKKSLQPVNYGSLRREESNGDSSLQKINIDHKLSGNFTPKTVDFPHGGSLLNRNKSVSRMSMSSSSSKNFKPKISNRVNILNMSGTPRGSAGRGKKFSSASNYLLPQTTTVIEKENSTDGDGTNSKEGDAKSDISIS